MKKIFLIIGGVVLLFIIFFAGYSVGGKIGRMYGAQQYTKKAWANNEMQISANAVLNKVNEIRAKNNMQPLLITNNLCKVADIRAKYVFDKASGNWSQDKQEYKPEQANAPESTESMNNTIKSTCPECKLDTYNDIGYVSLRPESCWNTSGIKLCEGQEEFGVLEKYTDRVINGWEKDPALKQILLAPVKNGCIGVYGGSVVLSIAQLK